MSKPSTKIPPIKAIETLKSWWKNLNFQVSAREGILFVFSIVALVFSVMTGIFWLRVVLLLIGLGIAVTLFFLNPPADKEPNIVLSNRDSKTDREPSSQHVQHKAKTHVKKILFDDFQATYGKPVESENANVIHSVPPVQETKIEPPPVAVIPPAIELLQKVKVQDIVDEQPVLEGFPTVKKEVKPPREFTTSDFFEVNSEMFRSDAEPRAEFNYLLNKVLAAVKDAMFGHTAAFFWANHEKQQMVLEARITDSKYFMHTRRFTIGNDLMSKVAESGKPELLTSVNPISEPELFMYYTSSSGVKSFAGVPVFYTNSSEEPAPDKPVAVLIVDSIVEDVFGEETIEHLGKFTKLISSLIKSYNSKYDLLVDSEIVSSLKRMKNRLRGDYSLFRVVQSLAEETSKMVNWDFLTVALYDESKNAWIAKKVMNRAYEPYIAPEQVIEFPNSIAGRTIKNNQFTIIDSLEKTPLPRFYSEERVNSKGSFLSIPISSLNKCYGSLNIESREQGNFSRKDIGTIMRLTEEAASILEILYLNDIIREHVIIDEVTGMYSKKFFLQRVGEELQRSNDNDVDLVMLMVSVDHAQEIKQRYGEHGFEQTISVLAKSIRASIRPYDVVGRLEANRFGILLINTTPSEAQIWAEKIRKNVASLTIALEEKSFSVTISVGVSGSLEGIRREELLANTVTVLHHAEEAGGNAVRVF